MYAVADGASIQIRFAARLLHPAAQLDLASVSSVLGCFFGFGRPGCGMACYFAVSYTHLDVYKRQGGYAVQHLRQCWAASDAHLLAGP